MNTLARTELRQRSDYTHRFNEQAGRHGWLRLTPAYSVRVVDELMDRYDGAARVLDPFCGTATTALSAAYRGYEGVTTDINPFLVWLGQAKTAQYSNADIASTQRARERLICRLRQGNLEPVKAPPMHNIKRWWSKEALKFLCVLRAGIEEESEAKSPERDLLLIAFCRTLIDLSNAAFNHQSMSFKEDGQLRLPIDADMEHIFCEGLRFVLRGAENNPGGSGKVVLGDAKNLPEVVDGQFDLVITSPPYANRMSYIRELRPYMYWLGFLDNGRDAGELDWCAIGGTWGVATSRLSNWESPQLSFNHPLLDAPLREITLGKNKNGKLLANYIAKYFNDISAHMKSLAPVLKSGSKLHYIVGNSVFYGILLPVEKLYAALLESLGFEDVDCSAIRKRNSKKELFEFDVSASWPG